MRIAVTSVGTAGDIQPFVALARGLMAAGHDVFFVTDALYAPLVARAGVPLRALSHWSEEKQRALMTRVLASSNPMKQFGIMFEEARTALATALPSMIEAVRDADLVVTHVLHVTGFMAALANGKPWITGHISHGHARALRAPGLRDTLERWESRLLWGVARRWIRRRTDPLLNELLRSVGLPALSDIFLEASHSPLLNLVALSPSVLAPDAAWERYELTGYWFLDDPAWKPDPRLEEFLAAGPPPVVVTFGSMQGMDARAFTAKLVEGVRGRRAIIQSGAAGLAGDALPDSIHVTGYVPHEWLFPRASCVVHHGGTGTLGSALRAGAPSVIAWCLTDHVVSAKLARRLGVAPPAVHHAALTPRWLAGAIRETEALRDRAKQLGETVRGERGVETAASLIGRAVGKL
ncbi:MAG TPA: glycosyltransferase [Planctomycetota bacterium]|nr:glycosyltransferase [Planctomycetota bacterium]